jgi:phosphatidate cytidylyltransferase
VSDRNDTERVTPAEGVRILGASEAQAAVDAREAGATPTVSAPRYSGERSADAGSQPFDLPDAGPSWSASAEGDAPAPPPLPHWTEPPTGAVPAIFADDSAEHTLDEDFDAWAPVTGSQPRFRDGGEAWTDADSLEDLSGEHERLGALSEAGPVDEEAEFAEAFEAARRRPGRRARGAAPVPAATHASRPSSESELTPSGPATSRDLPTAIMTAVTVAIAALVCFNEGPNWVVVLAAIIVGVASVEMANALRNKGLKSAAPLALVASATLPLAAKHYGADAYPIYVGIIVLVSLLWYLWEVTPGRPLLGVAITVLTFAYVGGLGGFAGLLLGRPSGVGLVIGLVLCVIAYDVVGFFIGSQFGRTSIAPRISPNKSVQGTVGGIAAAIIMGLLVGWKLSPWTAGSGFVLGVLVGFGAFLGDLCESMIKRDLGLKDFGTLLPGHGGVLDRFDGLLFCLPIAYYLSVALKLH